MITKGFILTKDPTLIAAKILRDHRSILGRPAGPQEPGGARWLSSPQPKPRPTWCVLNCNKSGRHHHVVYTIDSTVTPLNTRTGKAAKPFTVGAYTYPTAIALSGATAIVVEPVRQPLGVVLGGRSRDTRVRSREKDCPR
jgi:hypothetical protein